MMSYLNDTFVSKNKLRKKIKDQQDVIDKLITCLGEAARSLETARYSEQPMAKKCRAIINSVTGKK